MTATVATDTTATRVERRPRKDLPVWAVRALGSVGLLLVWWIVARTVLPQSKGVPTPFNVVKSMVDDGWGFYWPGIKATGQRALEGYLVGNGIAIALAAVVLLLPFSEKVILQVGLASYCLPLAAIGPILTITLTGDKPVVALTSLFVIFTTLVGAILGLQSADTTSLDLVKAYGGGTWQQLIKVRIIAALPSILAALKVAAPTAAVGAVVGEELGGVSNVGLGYAMIASEQAVNVPRTWALALVIALIGGLGYVVLGLVQRYLTPWAAQTDVGGPR